MVCHEPSTINSQLSTRSSPRKLLNHFLKLCPKHVYLSAHQIAPKRDAGRAKVSRLRTKRVKPAALFTGDGEYGRLSQCYT